MGKEEKLYRDVMESEREFAAGKGRMLHSLKEKNPYSGKFICFEGLDGSGQSTQAKLLKEFLGRKAILTKEPRPENKIIREILDQKENLNPKILQELFAQDREEHLEKEIIPALKQGKTIICDRYMFSSFAYGQIDGVNLKYLIEINNQFLMPDIVFFLDVRPEVCLERIKKRGRERTLFEEKEKLARVYQNYKNLAKRFKNVHIIDGERPVEKIAKEIADIVASKLG